VFFDPKILTRFRENPRGHAPDAEVFETLLWEICEQYYARIHAYAMEPDSALIVIQPLGAPLAWVMHDLLARYAMHWVEQQRTRTTTKLFPRRYKAQIVQPSKLPYAVRYVQRREIAAMHWRRSTSYPFSSHPIYCGRRPQPKCFLVNPLREALRSLGYIGPEAYFEFMVARDSPSIAHMLCRRVIGEHHFIELARDCCRKPRTAPSPDEILQEVASTLLHTDPEVVCSSSHLGALARALVAWYAMRNGTAPIGTVARWFGVTSSDLRYLIRRHQRTSPHYFAKSRHDMFPALLGREEIPKAESGISQAHATPYGDNLPSEAAATGA